MRHAIAISWAMPPLLAPRALQVSRLLKGARRYGWETTVVCADADLSIPGIAIDPVLDALYVGEYACAPVPYGKRNSGTAQGSNPDDDWVRSAEAMALNLIGRCPFDLLITFAQPWFDHEVGLRLKKATGLPWIAHFSDPWVDSPYYDSLDQAKRELWSVQEATVIGTADAVVFTTRETADLVMRKYPSSWAAKVRILPHGFDGDLLSGISREPAPGRLRIVHAGDFYEGKRTPTTLLKALDSLEKKPEWAGRLQLFLVGSIPDRHMAEIADLGMSDRVEILGRRPYLETLAVSASADILVVVDSKADVNVFLPSKAVDYLMLRKPIVGLTPSCGATSALLREVGFDTVEPDDVEGAARILEAALKRCRSAPDVLPDTFDAVAQRYRIDHVASQFAALADNMAAGAKLGTGKIVSQADLNQRPSQIDGRDESNMTDHQNAMNPESGTSPFPPAGGDPRGALVCPDHRRPLALRREENGGQGGYTCPEGCCFPVVRGIPRFTPSESYASGFGWQWRKFSRIQLDSYTGTSITRDRLKRCLGGSFEAIRGKTVLEAGCGAGRFSEALLDEGARLFACDLSSAVEASHANFVARPDYFLCQANITRLPLPEMQFDAVICLGVIQHTPDPEATIRALASHVKPGGLLVLDHYSLEYEYTKPRQRLRRFILRLPPRIGSWLTILISEALLRFHRRYWDFSPRSARMRDFLNKHSPLVDYFTVYPALPRNILERWCVLDTHDTITDFYKHLRSPEQIRASLEALRFEDIRVNRGGNGVEAMARRPSRPAAA